MAGQLPHRDFDEMYTGGLAWWHGVAFLLFGTRLTSLRYALTIATIPFTLAYFDIVRRFCRPAIALVITCAALLASLGTWPTGHPTWYLLIVTTLGTWALVRYWETRRLHWVFISGLFGGLAILIKVTGFFFLASAGLFLTALAESAASDSATERPARSAAHTAWEIILAATAVFCVVAMLAEHLDINTIAFLALPAAAMGPALLLATRQPRPAVLLVRYACFAAGPALALLLLVTPYALSGSLADLWNGLIVLPRIRFTAAYCPAPAVGYAVAAIPLAVLCLLKNREPPGRLLAMTAVAVLGLTLLLALATKYGTAMGTFEIRLAMGSWCWLLTVLALPVLWLLCPRGQLADQRSALIYLLYASAAFFALNQYPYMEPSYALFTSPLVFLAALGVATRCGHPPRAALCLGLALVGLFCGLRFSRGGYYREYFQPPISFRALNVPRGGLIIPEGQALVFEAIDQALRQHVGPGQTVLAGPDCPEIYFLSGFRNPTRIVYDIFDTKPNRNERILALVDDPAIAAVVVNQGREFSAPWEESLLQQIAARSEKIVRYGSFLVFFKPAKTFVPAGGN
jgi:hypothetical protein